MRWYKLPPPPPGVYALGDYSSSDWDDDPKSYDPPNGEESTTRLPFVDWRDCSPPPWPEQNATDCPTVVSPTLPAYTVRLKLRVLVPPGYTIAGTFTLAITPDCFWDVVIPLGGGDFADLSMFFGSSGEAIMSLGLVIGGIAYSPVSWTSDGPADATQPIPVDVFTSDPTIISGEGPATLRPVYPTLLSTREGYQLGTEDGNFILVT